MKKPSRQTSSQRRAVCVGLAGGAAAMFGAGWGTGPSRAATSDAGLDRDEDGYALDEEAREMLRWWSTPAGVTRAYLGHAGQQIHVRLAQPEAPLRRPVVLLHDAGLSGRVWDHALPLLAADRAVLAPDLPAHGDSDGDPLTSTSGHAAAVMRVADQLELDQFDLVGAGLGAHVALTLAAIAPTRVGRLILRAAAINPVPPPRPDPADPEDAAFLSNYWRAFAAGYQTDVPLGLVDRDFADLLRARSAPARDNGALSLATAVRQDTLVIASGDGRAAEWAAALSNGRLHPSYRWRRGAPAQQAAEWADTVKTFLDRDRAEGGLERTASPDPAPARAVIARRFMNTPGGQMHYRMVQGDAGQPPLICFHMSPRSSAYYEAMMQALAAAGRTVIAVDTPGYGESFKPSAWLNVPGYATHMAQFIAALGLPQVDLMGDHTGSKIAVETARQVPDRVRRMVMNTAGVYSRAEQLGWQQRMGAIDIASDGSHYANLWERYHTLNRGKLDSDQNAFRFFETVRAGPCMWWGSRAANLYILGEILPEIEHEILLVCSDEDSLIEPTRRGAPLLRNGRYVEFPGQGNSMFEYRVAAVAPTIAAFLAA